MAKDFEEENGGCCTKMADLEKGLKENGGIQENEPFAKVRGHG